MLLPSPPPTLEPKLPARPGPRWRNVPIGGGGYVTGLALHPAIPDCLYFRTDVGGAFRFDPAGERWIPLLDSVAYPDRNYMGIDGIALAPSRPGRLAIAAGQLTDRTPSDVLWSDDHGATWRATRLNRAFGGNLPHRMNGECLAFHPGNPDHLLAGTRNDGLFETRDAGQSWRHLAGVPAGTPEIGIRCVLFAPDRLFVAVEGAGIFASADEGTNWTLLPGSPRHVGRMAFGGGRLFVTSRDPGGLWAYDGVWRNLSPMADRNYHALAVDPLDPDRVLVSPLDDPSGSRFRLPIFFSADGGASWRVVAAQPDWESAARWMKPTHFGAATSALLFDPHHPGRVYLADWYAVWRTDDIADRPVLWRALMKGHEEMFLFTLATPPKGPPLLTGMADNTGFRHVSADAPPEGRLEAGREATGIDFCEAAPARVVVASGRRYPTLEYAVYVSDDHGRTFVRRETPVSNTFERTQRIAVSATDQDRFVLLANDDEPYVTADAGRSWQTAAGAPHGALPGRTLWCYHHPLAADRVDGRRFYLYREGVVFVSEDGGATWSPRRERLPASTDDFINVTAAPGHSGWLAVGLGGAGLWLSKDAAATFSRNGFIEACLLVAWGAPLSPASPPALYAYGRHAGKWAIFCSTDVGGSWTRVNADGQTLGGFPSCLAGDRQTPGRIYLGTNGRGVFVGDT